MNTNNDSPEFGRYYVPVVPEHIMQLKKKHFCHLQIQRDSDQDEHEGYVL